MIGVSFEIPQVTNSVLWNILGVIDISKYSWYCDRKQTEVWDEAHERDFFAYTYYDGEQFSKHIQSNHRIVFLKLQGHTTMQDFSSIQTYNEFVHSDCQIIVLIYDCENVEIYIKNVVELEAIYERVKASGYQNIEFIDDKNLERKKMDVI